MSLFKSKPFGITRFLLRLPVLIYNLRLGWLLDHRFLLLTHRGRATGCVRQTVLEVIRYDVVRRESTVLSGWGKKSDWFRNIEKAPALAVHIGCYRFDPIHRILTTDEGYSLLKDWQRQHPIEGWIFRKLFDVPSEATEAGLRDFVVLHPLIAFRPQPPGTEKGPSREPRRIPRP